tara:strand:- start:226 stop:465 length:240 start_codon:yes stop_codon:yes gene_type:complete
MITPAVNKGVPGEVDASTGGNLLTIEEVAERLRVSTQTVREIIRGRRITVIKLSAQTTRIRELDLKQFIKNNTIPCHKY